MSKEKKQRTERESDYSSDCTEEDQFEILEAGNGRSGSTANYVIHASNDLLPNTNQNIQRFVDEGIEVQASDVLTIEELQVESCSEQTSEDELEAEILYHFPAEFDEETCSHFPDAYIDSTNNLDTQENREKRVSGFNEVHSLPEIQGKQKDKLLNPQGRKTLDAAVTDNILKADGTSEATTAPVNKKIVKELKEKNAPTLEMKNNKCKLLKTSHVPIFQFKCPTTCGVSGCDEAAQKIKCPEYGSDEFADIEDNIKDSSSDSSKLASDKKPAMSKPSKDVERKPKQGRKADNYGGGKALKDASAACSSSYKNSLSRDKLEDQSFPSTSKKSSEYQVKTVPVLKDSNEVKKKVKGALGTIEEAPASEDGMQVLKTRPQHSKGNSLKMKTRVGNKKDKCNVCNVRLGLCAIKCRCGGYYCAKHRYDKEHDCTFDYRKMGAEEIRKNNPKIIAEKVRKL